MLPYVIFSGPGTFKSNKLSASSRISKGQGYQGFIRKRAGSRFGQKRAICVVQGKTLGGSLIELIS
jgi:hypothetical protein